MEIKREHVVQHSVKVILTAEEVLEAAREYALKKAELPRNTTVAAEQVITQGDGYEYLDGAEFDFRYEVTK